MLLCAIFCVKYIEKLSEKYQETKPVKLSVGALIFSINFLF